MADKNRVRNKNPILAPENAYNLQEGDNRKFLAASLKIAKLPRVNLRNPEEVEERLNTYFDNQLENDTKPTVTGIAMALGISKQELWSIRTGNHYTIGGLKDLPTLTIELIKKSYEIIENLYENYMLNGKINPVAGIFMGKNHFGYKDTQEHVLTPNTNQENYSTDEIKKRYLIEDK